MNIPLKLSDVKTVQQVSVKNFYDANHEQLQLRLLNSPKGFSRPITVPSINRPGLALSGFYEHFEHRRIQVFGAAEVAYIQSLPEDMRRSRLEAVFRGDTPCIIFARGMAAPEDVFELADRYSVCVFMTDLVTIKFVNAATIILEKAFAESTTAHGCMVDLRGLGVLIVGESGVGKSEDELGVVEHGVGSMVADDIVRMRRLGGDLVASAPEMSYGFIEVRGLGVINVVTLFGLKAFRKEKRVDLIIVLKPGIDLDMDRLGLEREPVSLMGVRIPYVKLPVAPGRDTSRLLEVVALEHSMRTEGFEMAGEFNRQLQRRVAEGKRMS